MPECFSSAANSTTIIFNRWTPPRDTLYKYVYTFSWHSKYKFTATCYSQADYSKDRVDFYQMLLTILELDLRWATKKGHSVRKLDVLNCGRNHVASLCPYGHLPDYPPFMHFMGDMDWRNFDLLKKWEEEGCKGRTRDLLRSVHRYFVSNGHTIEGDSWEKVLDSFK